MISKKNLQNIQNLKMKKKVRIIIPYIIFFSCLITCYILNLIYDNNSSLVNDKLIDVSSIFFGVFLGCLYLFEKFKNNKTYQEFLKFCKRLLYMNIFIIAYSFIIILINDLIPEFKSFCIFEIDIIIKLKALLFSLYLSFFGLTLYNMYRFLKIVLIILETNNKT